MRFSRVESLGVFLPPDRRSTAQLLDALSVTPPFDLQAVTGIEQHRVTTSDCTALAADAARDALSRSSYAPGELDVVISCSISRFHDGSRLTFEPALATHIARSLGAVQAIQFDVSNACAGMMTGVLVLDRLIRAGVVRNGLVVSGERITPIADTAVREIDRDDDLQFASLTVGDSAAAVVLDESVDEHDRIHHIEMMSCAEYAGLCLGMPSNRTQGVALYTDNRRMHNKDRLRLWPDLHRLVLEKAGTTFAGEGYDHLIHHQVGAVAIRNFQRCGEAAFGVPMPDSPTVYEQYGNTASTSHFLALHDHLRRAPLRGPRKYLFVPAASGLVTGFMSATVSKLEV
ncbi:3-oxoacyl-ACP synthase [Lentzea aerocolonigenes]|uniref:3-oxoacyl-ACP synthase n=1 Tax=Lentzea aerocolonigenes TaxID=68170 RepID=A0A0F0H0Z2_LENAE|nr:3-oxoacyl-[acyl-carrier-protein] synthase III C-terminal domain-containing protein [Lentzea aerocolonigenes]KJK49240.1 3-oxoacyl-ACP synthase [Lentzea aerocolonigenes]